MADPTKTELSLDTGSTSVSSGARAVAPLSPEPSVPLPQAKRLNNDSKTSTFIRMFLSIIVKSKFDGKKNLFQREKNFRS